MAAPTTLDMDRLAELLDDDVDDPMAPTKHLAAVKSDPAVQDLAARVGIDLAPWTWPLQLRGPNRFRGLKSVMLPLVRAGLDTRENLDLLFGDARRVADCQRELRMMTLLAPPEGSPACMMGYRAPAPCDPDAPAPPAVLAALPRWQRPLRPGECGGEAPDCAICQAVLEAGTTVQTLPDCPHLYHPGKPTGVVRQPLGWSGCLQASPAHACPRPPCLPPPRRLHPHLAAAPRDLPGVPRGGARLGAPPAERGGGALHCSNEAHAGSVGGPGGPSWGRRRGGKLKRAAAAMGPKRARARRARRGVGTRRRRGGGAAAGGEAGWLEACGTVWPRLPTGQLSQPLLRTASNYRPQLVSLVVSGEIEQGHCAT